MFDSAMMASVVGMMSSLFPNPEAAAALGPEQRAFLSHFQAAFAKTVAPGGSAAATPVLASPAPPAALAAEPFAASASKPRRPAAGAGATQPAEPRGDGSSGGGAAAAPPSSADAQAAHAMFLGQTLLAMAQIFPGMAAVVAALTSMMPGAAAALSGGGGGAAAPGGLCIAPLAAPAFVQTTFGEVLAARMAGGAPKGAPFSLERECAATPLKAANAEDTRGLETQTPVSLQHARPGSAARKSEGANNPLAFLAMAALDARS
jgi:hypothetical protein